jgi:hypothetical protein
MRGGARGDQALQHPSTGRAARRRRARRVQALGAAQFARCTRRRARRPRGSTVCVRTRERPHVAHRGCVGRSCSWLGLTRAGCGCWPAAAAPAAAATPAPRRAATAAAAAARPCSVKVSRARQRGSPGCPLRRAATQPPPARRRSSAPRHAQQPARSAGAWRVSGAQQDGDGATAARFTTLYDGEGARVSRSASPAQRQGAKGRSCDAPACATRWAMRSSHAARAGTSRRPAGGGDRTAWRERQ